MVYVWPDGDALNRMVRRHPDWRGGQHHSSGVHTLCSGDRYLWYVYCHYHTTGQKEKIGQSRVGFCGGIKLYFHLCACPQSGIDRLYHHHLYHCGVGLWGMVLSHQ